MRSSLFWLLIVALMGVVVLFTLGCGGSDSLTATTVSATTAANQAVEVPIPYPQDPAVTLPEEQPSPYGAGTTSSQVVGTLIDGLQLRDIRWSDHGTYYRIVFDVGTPDGQSILQVPHAESSMSADHKQVKVVVGGIRSIGASTSVNSTSLSLGDTLVKTIKRLPESDDQALVYSIELASPSTYSLAGVGSPGRIIIDINKA